MLKIMAQISVVKKQQMMHRQRSLVNTVILSTSHFLKFVLISTIFKGMFILSYLQENSIWRHIIGKSYSTMRN